MKVKELMRSRGLLTIGVDDDMALAQQMLSWGGVRHLPVISGGRPVGMLTEHDLLRHRAEAGAAGNRDAVKLFMSHPVETIGPDEDVAQASALLVAKKIGCLPVMDGETLVGVLTTTDIVASHVVIGPARGLGASKPSRRLTAGEAMRREIATVHPYQPLLEAVGMMVDRGIRHVTVVDDERRVVGIISDRDVRTAIGDPLEALHSELEELEQMKVSGVMTTPVLTVAAETPLSDVAKRFVDERIGAVPVVDERHRPIGIVSYVDVIRTLQRALQP